MRVGLYVQGMHPETGGGHTFEREALAAINRARPAGRHDFVAFGFAPGPPVGWELDHYLTLRPSGPHRALDIVLGRLGREPEYHRLGGRLWIDDVVQTRDIDLVWSLGPGCPVRSTPYVATVWDLQHRLQPIFPEVSSRGEWTAREERYARELGQASMVIVGTAAGQAEVERFYGIPPTRIRRLPHPTPSFALEEGDAGASDVLARNGLEPGFVLYPAQFWPHKNHANLLRALRWLRDEHSITLPAVFVGADKGAGAHVRAVVTELGLQNSVHFLGFVPEVDLIALYRAALALCYPSFFGPENLPPLEAFGLGCPVVAADVSGSDEQLGDAAVRVAPTDPAAIGRALLAIRDDPELRKTLIDRGRQRARLSTTADFVAGMFAVVDELEPIIRTWR
jgi:glycosyltransferase involved in cell wall biosynthesis